MFKLIDEIRLLGLTVVFILCLCGNGFAYIIDGDLTSAGHWSWWAGASYNPVDGGWQYYSGPQGDGSVGANEFRIISEYGNTGIIPVDYYLTGVGSYSFNITGVNCTAKIDFTTNVAEYHFLDLENPFNRPLKNLEIGHLYSAKTWLYDADPIITELIVTDPTKNAYFDVSGGGTVQFNIILPDEMNPVPEPSTIFLLGVGFGGLVFCRKWFRG